MSPVAARSKGKGKSSWAGAGQALGSGQVLGSQKPAGRGYVLVSSNGAKAAGEAVKRKSPDSPCEGKLAEKRSRGRALQAALERAQEV